MSADDDDLLFRLNEVAADIGTVGALGNNVGRMRLAAERAAGEVLAIRAAFAARLGRCPTQCDDVDEIEALNDEVELLTKERDAAIKTSQLVAVHLGRVEADRDHLRSLRNRLWILLGREDGVGSDTELIDAVAAAVSASQRSQPCRAEGVTSGRCTCS